MSTCNKKKVEFVATSTEPTTTYRVTNEQLTEVLAKLSKKNEGCAAPHPAVGQKVFLDGKKTDYHTPLSALGVIRRTGTSRSGSRLCQFANPEASRTGVFYFRLSYTKGEVTAELLEKSKKSNGSEMLLCDAGQTSIVNNTPASGGGWAT